MLLRAFYGLKVHFELTIYDISYIMRTYSSKILAKKILLDVFLEED